ncbi:MAG: cytochrome c, partial [Myxococcota bacterium]|nr:cytochrome c [Myxococcota bacterium]
QETGPRGGGPAPGSVATGGAAADASGAQRMFMTVCATCHGTDGTGNGPAAESLNPKPRNYRDPAWQASVTDAEIKKIIVEGGQANGKSPMMPANPHLKDQPEALDGLVTLIRSFGKQ